MCVWEAVLNWAQAGDNEWNRILRVSYGNSSLRIENILDWSITPFAGRHCFPPF